MLGLVELNITFVLQIINFLVLFLVLRHFLWKPVTEFMNNRTQSIEDSIKEAEVKYKQSEELKAQYEEKLKEIKKERVQVIDEATETAKNRSQQIINAAEEDARNIVERAREQVEREKQNMMNELKGEISHLAIAAAEKIIEKNLDEKAHQQMIQQFIDKAGEAKWLN